MNHLPEARMLLTEAAQQFRYYATQHQNKLSDPDLSEEQKLAAHNKMRINDANAEKIEDFLRRSSTLTYEQFLETYQPILDGSGEPKRYSPVELAAVSPIKECTWTMLDCGALVAGYHYVDRDYHLIATIPWSDDSLEVPSEIEDGDEDGD